MADLTPPPSQNNTPLRPSDNAEPSSPTLRTAETSTEPLATTLADANDGPAPTGMDVDEEARSVDEESGAQSDAELAAETESDDGMIEEESDNDDKSGNDSDDAMAIEAERIRATEEKLAAFSDWNKDRATEEKFSEYSIWNKDQEIESDTTSEGGSARKHRRVSRLHLACEACSD